MLYTNTLYTGREIWDEVLHDPTGFLAGEITRRYCTKILEGVYVPNFNLDDKYWIDKYNGDWDYNGFLFGKCKCSIHRESKFHSGRRQASIV